MTNKKLEFILILLLIFMIACSKPPENSIAVDIKNAEYKEGNLLLTVQTSEATKNARIDIVGDQGQILCSKYKDLAAGTNQFELPDCRVEKQIKVSISPPGQPVVIEDFKLKLPTPVVKIEGARYEFTNLILSLNANLEITNARIEIASGGNVLCTKYTDLPQGKNQFKIMGCGNEEKIIVSVTPPGGTLVTKDFKMELPLVKVQSAIYDLSTLVLTFDANAEMKNTRVDVIKDGNVLCTKYIDLSQGQSQKRIDDCGVEEKLAISVTPVGGLLSTKDFSLSIPVLKLQKGYKYDYAFVQSASSSPIDISIFVIEDSSESWEVIGGIKERDVAYLHRFKISKSDLTMRITNSLKENEVLGNVEYKSLKEVNSPSNAAVIFPFWFVWMKESGNLNLEDLFNKKTTIFSFGSSDPITLKVEKTVIRDNFLVNEIIVIAKRESDNGKIYASTLKPFLLTNIEVASGGGLVFKGLQKKDFSLSDFAGYQIGGYTATPAVRQAEVQEAVVEQPRTER